MKKKMKAYCDIAWLIDDDPVTNYMTERIISMNNFADHVHAFTTIEHALNELNRLIKIGEGPFPDIIFLDINMPGLDGWDFLDAFRLLPGEVKEKCELYMLSSSIDNYDIKKAKEYEDVQDFISKPLTKEDLEIIKEKKEGLFPGFDNNFNLSPDA